MRRQSPSFRASQLGRADATLPRLAAWRRHPSSPGGFMVLATAAHAPPAACRCRRSPPARGARVARGGGGVSVRSRAPRAMSAHVRFVEGERPGSCSSARRRWRQGEPSIANLLLPPSRLHLRNLNLHQGLARGMVYCLLDCIPAFWMSDGIFLCFPGDCWSSVDPTIGSVFLSLYLPVRSLWYLSEKT